MHHLSLLITLLLITLFYPYQSSAQVAKDQTRIKSIGIPFMETYSLSDYSSKQAIYGAQNYDVLIGDDQKVCFANIEGLLVFDGVNWTRLRLPGRAGTYSLTKAKDGTIYVGGLNEIGYLGNSINGKLQYHSLMPELRKITEENFTGFSSFMWSDQAVFSDIQKLIIYNPETKEIQLIKNPRQTRPIQQSNQGKLFSYHSDSLYQLVGDRWKALRLSSLGNPSNSKNTIPVDIKENETIVITNNGFFDFESEQKINIDESVTDFLRQSTLISAELLADKYLSIATNRGALITDLDGNPVQYLNEQKGLSNNLVLNTTLDATGMLWVATNYGITKVEISSPYSLFDKRAGLTGNVSFVEDFNDDIYLATANGTLRQKWSQLTNPLQDYNFENLNPSESRYLIETAEELFSLSNKTPLKLQNGTLQIIDGNFANYYWTGIKFRETEDLLLGTRKGELCHLVKKQGKWEVKKTLLPSVPDILFMAQGDGNNVWIAHRNGLIKLEYDLENSTVISTKTYSQEDGLPYPTDNYVFQIGSKPCFSTFGGIYRYDAATDGFVPDERFIASLGDQPVLRITEDPAGNIYCLGDGILILQKTSEGYQLQRILNEKIADYNPFNITAFDSANILMPTFGALVHVDPTIPLDMDAYTVNITGIESVGEADTSYYGGFGGLLDVLALSARDNSLRIGFSSAFYQNIDRTEYKWRIKELDNNWSEWSLETQKDYTNLPHGTYTFEVVAKNVHFVESEPASFRFTVLPPWYFTWWAYALYLGCLVLLIWAIVKIYTRKIRLDRDQLEGIVIERTKEISEQKKQVELDAAIISEQRDKLVKMDDLKSRFFINISHELRTPLTLAMGTVERALNGSFGAINAPLKENLDLSRRNSRRLLKMVNNILDISKLESSSYEIQVSRTLVSARLLKVLDYFSSRFHNKNITISSRLSSEAHLYIDPEKFETIFINIIGNAFKFTPNGGTVTITDKEDDQWLHINISDTGAGIPADSIPFVFDRFYQNPDQVTDQGTGLGLALCKELVELHHGKVAVSSEYGEGSTFTVSFQKGMDHFRQDQIVTNPVKETTDKDIILPDDLEVNPITTPQRNDGAPHILIVEDNPEMSRFIADILAEDYQVSLAENGQKGLDFLEENTPDLILTDYLMPEMDGFEMASKIKQHKQHLSIPMIFLTARAEEQDRVNVLNLGVDDYLAKPFSSDELLARIKNLIAAKSRREEFIKEQDINSSDIEWTVFNSKLRTDLDNYIAENIKKEITALELAEHMSQSERNLNRKVKAGTGFSLAQYVKEYRLRRARTLLENQEKHNVSEVSYAVGFNYLSHFTKSYKERFGKMPSEYLE